MLRRFLRARTYDLEKATAMWLNNLKFKQEFGVDTILQDFYFGERDKFLVCFPQGYHKTDKMVRCVRMGCGLHAGVPWEGPLHPRAARLRAHRRQPTCTAAHGLQAGHSGWRALGRAPLALLTFPLRAQGRPIYIQLLGQVNVEQIKKITTEERMLKFHIQVRAGGEGARRQPHSLWRPPRAR